MTEEQEISSSSLRYRDLFPGSLEKALLHWLQQCTARGLIVMISHFREEVLRIAQTKPNCPKSRDEVEPLVDVFWERWAPQLVPACSSRPVDPRCPVLGPQAWFRSVSEQLATHYPGVPFADPERFFCMSEVNLRLDAERGHLMALRPAGEQADRDNLALAVVVSAAGARAPLLAVAPTDGPLQSDTADDDSFCTTTTNGTLTSRAMRKYVEKSLNPYLTAQSVARPVLLFVDGLHHYASPALSKLCDVYGIVLVGLPPGGQDLNPTRSAVTDTLAPNVVQLMAVSAAGCSSVRELVADAWNIMQPSKRDIKQAFRSSGLYPWSEAVVISWDDPDVPSEILEVVFESTVAGPPSPPSPGCYTENEDDASQESNPDADRLDLSATQHPDFVPGIAVPLHWRRKVATIKILLEAGSGQYSVLESVPSGRKENITFMVVSEQGNSNEKMKFSDDADGWTNSAISRYIYLVSDDLSKCRVIHKADVGGYFLVVKGERKMVDPQDLKGSFIVHTYSQTSKWPTDPNYVRKVSWIVACEPPRQAGIPAVALYEYKTLGKSAKKKRPKAPAIAWHEPEPASVVGEPTTQLWESTGLSSDWPVPVDGTVDAGFLPCLGTQETIKALMGKTQKHAVLKELPAGRKDNIAYLVYDPNRQDELLPSRLVDDVGPWLGEMTERKLYLLQKRGVVMLTRDEAGLFCRRKTQDGLKSDVPLDPQPADQDVVELVRLHSIHEKCSAKMPYKRRITWLESVSPEVSSVPPVALCEYFGCLTEPHPSQDEQLAGVAYDVVEVTPSEEVDDGVVEMLINNVIIDGSVSLPQSGDDETQEASLGQVEATKRLLETSTDNSRPFKKLFFVPS